MKRESVAAVIVANSKILAVQRDASIQSYLSHKFEFPCGELEYGETHEEALKRTVKAELDLEISVGHKIAAVHHYYPEFDLVINVFFCSIISGAIKLNDYTAYRWLSHQELYTVDWVGANIPVIDLLEEHMKP